MAKTDTWFGGLTEADFIRSQKTFGKSIFKANYFVNYAQSTRQEDSA